MRCPPLSSPTCSSSPVLALAAGTFPVLPVLFSPAEQESTVAGASTLMGLLLIGYLWTNAGEASTVGSIIRMVALGVGDMFALDLIGSLVSGHQQCWPETACLIRCRQSSAFGRIGAQTSENAGRIAGKRVHLCFFSGFGLIKFKSQ